MTTDGPHFPYYYLVGEGARAHPVVPLTWATLLISCTVVLIIAVLLTIAVLRFRARGGADEVRAVPPERGGAGLRWITIGVGISLVPLLVTAFWTIGVLGAVSPIPRNHALTIDVEGHQWWWGATYQSGRPSEVFDTANELHIPVGLPVRIRLRGRDVIHSFWVPRLSGKTDVIPGVTNVTWLQADHPGVFEGRCAEYCGWQHANMRLKVIAESLADFERWRRRQLQTAPPASTPQQQRGLELVEFRCGVCHRVRGTTAGGVVAPDLTHLMSRTTLAAGTISNNSGALAGWIANPQNVKPGTLMPALDLTAADLNDIRSYLETLK